VPLVGSIQLEALQSDGSNGRTKIFDEVVEGSTPLLRITDPDDRCGVHRRNDQLSGWPTLHLASPLRDPE
jgi:hypothetical protein